MEPARSYSEALSAARIAEREGDLTLAIRMYERAVRLEPLSETAYNRLMILHRKRKDYEKELAVIRKAIASFEAHFDAKSRKLLGGSGSAAKLSRSLAQALGQRDRKGMRTVYPEPLATWQKRCEGVEKRLRQTGK